MAVTGKPPKRILPEGWQVVKGGFRCSRDSAVGERRHFGHSMELAGPLTYCGGQLDGVGARKKTNAAALIYRDRGVGVTALDHQSDETSPDGLLS
jgi:hypothetical protein